MHVLTVDELNLASGGQGIGWTLAVDAGNFVGGGAGMLAGRLEELLGKPSEVI